MNGFAAALLILLAVFLGAGALVGLGIIVASLWGLLWKN